jgi:cephalosporin-C deacetylase-like acetyl esterase
MMYKRSPRGAHDLAFAALEADGGGAAAWKALGFTDAMCHAHRLTMPVLLTAGLLDGVCHPDTIKSLFDVLPGTRSYSEFAGQGHAYTTQFLHMAMGWFRLYV